MQVLAIFAHPESRSFCDAVLERSVAGLRDAGHTNEIVDLYARRRSSTSAPTTQDFARVCVW
jgi:putative NADPH-quinone reductase